MTKKIILSLIFLIVLLSSTQLVSAESKYTREKSEELFHLIDWQEYKPETFEKALEEQKPIFLMLSAPAWCYWCHVYESEDYLYHLGLYPYINENFIPIFVDSDKRPDLTRKYLEGGWPSKTIFSHTSVIFMTHYLAVLVLVMFQSGEKDKNSQEVLHLDIFLRNMTKPR